MDDDLSPPRAGPRPDPDPIALAGVPRCGACGDPVLPDDLFCEACGHRLLEGRPAPAFDGGGGGTRAFPSPFGTQRFRPRGHEL